MMVSRVRDCQLRWQLSCVPLWADRGGESGGALGRPSVRSVRELWLQPCDGREALQTGGIRRVIDDPARLITKLAAPSIPTDLILLIVLN